MTNPERPERTRANRSRGSYAVAIVLAVGVSTALNLLTFAVLWDALLSPIPGISENATQILTGWGGGIIGVIGAVVGYQAGAASPFHTSTRDGRSTYDAE